MAIIPIVNIAIKGYKKLRLLKKGADVIRGTSKSKSVSSAPGNILNDKYQGRYFFERAKTKKQIKLGLKPLKVLLKQILTQRQPGELKPFLRKID